MVPNPLQLSYLDPHLLLRLQKVIKKNVIKNTDFTFVNKQQLPLVNVFLRKVVHSLHGGALKGQVSIARRSNHVAEILGG